MFVQKVARVYGESGESIKTQDIAKVFQSRLFINAICLGPYDNPDDNVTFPI